MTAAEFRSIRLRLGLTQPQLAGLLAYRRPHYISMLEGETASSRSVPVHVAMLMQAFADGYRPANWPKA